MNTINEEIKKIILNNSPIIIGVSSGPDSMCLLDIIKKYNKSIVVAHVNYHRRKQSNVEEKYLKNYCIKNNIIFETLSVDNYQGENFQQEAREIRYKFFFEMLKKYNSSYIFVAHHADDLIETILMRIARGSTLKGYAGFSSVTKIDQNYVIRPLINWTKEEIVEYNKNNNIKYYEDKSNFSDDYTRNRYRNNIIPKLKKESSNLHLKYYKYSQSLLEADELINDISNKKFKKIVKNQIIDLNQFIDNKKIIQERIIMIMLDKIYNDDIIQINSKHVEDILSMIYSKKPNVVINLPKHLRAIKSYDKLYFEFKKNNEINYLYTLNDKVVLPNGDLIFKTNDYNKTDNNSIRLNSKKIKMPIIVRTRKNGDKMQIKNSIGHTKLSQIFIDLKIDNKQRSSWPIVVDSINNILWIPKLKKSVFEETTDYDIVLEYQEKRKENEYKK